MSEGGYQYAGAQSDGAGSCGGESEHHPHIGALVWGVEQPCPVIAQAFSDGDVFGRIQRGRELHGYLHRRWVLNAASRSDAAAARAPAGAVGSRSMRALMPAPS